MKQKNSNKNQLSFGNALFDKLNIAKTLFKGYEREDIEGKTVSKKQLNDAMDNVYRRGDDVMKGFITLHLILAIIFATFTGTWQTTLLVGISTWFIFSLVVFWKPREFFTRAFAGIAIQIFVILHIYQFQGLGELRFFFFTAFTIMIVYRDWKALIPSFLIMVIQYIFFAYIQLHNLHVAVLDLDLLKYTGNEFNTEVAYQYSSKLEKDFLDYAKKNQKKDIKRIDDIDEEQLIDDLNAYYGSKPEKKPVVEGLEGRLSLKRNLFMYIKAGARIGVDLKRLGIYLGIILFQVFLCGTWANALKQQTILEVINKQALLEKQEEIQKANQELEGKVQSKTIELQKALETAQANEERLKQNMEELRLTQEGMQAQSQQLIKNQMEMKAVEKELRERQSEMEEAQWLESSLTKIDEVMRLNYSSDINTFSDILMQSIAEITEATQAAVYILEDEYGYLKMKGGYACTIDTVKQPKFLVGEGILGQAVKTKKMTYIDELPLGGAVVESGLTKINSKSLIIMPLVYNEEVQGIIEIATLGAIPDLHKEFMERVSRNIASMLKNLRSIANTENLLKQSQEMGQKYRESAEELARTKQEVELKAIEFQTQFNAINQVMLVIEFDIDGYIINANRKFLDLSYYEKQEIVGKHQTVLLEYEYSISNKYKTEWVAVQNGENVQAEYKCLSKRGSEFWIRVNYYTLGEGNQKRIMILGYDTTLQKLQEIQIKDSLQELQKKEEEMLVNMEVVESLKNQLEEQARASKAQLNAINVSTAMVEFDASGNILLVNDKFKDIFGYEDKEVIGKHHKMLVDAKFQKSVAYKNFWDKLAQNDFIDGEFESRSKEGKEIWLRGSYYPVTNQDNEVEKILLLATNITNEVKQEEQITQHLLTLEKAKTAWKDKTEVLSAQLNAIEEAVGMIEFNAEGEILKISQKFLDILKFVSQEVLLGKRYDVLFTKKCKNDKVFIDLWNNLMNHQYVEAIFELLTKDNQPMLLRTLFAPVADIQNNVFKVFAIVTDDIQTSNA